jgi:hypothetical protein
MQILRDETITARKIYHCDACRIFDNSGIGEDDLESSDDWLIYKLAEVEEFKIHPGQKYRKCVYKDGGEIITYRGREDMDSLCQKYELFED